MTSAESNRNDTSTKSVTIEDATSNIEEEENEVLSTNADNENISQNDSIDGPLNPNVKSEQRSSLLSSIFFSHDMNTEARPNYLAPAMSCRDRFCKRVQNFFRMTPKETQTKQGIEQHRIQPRKEKFVISALGSIFVSFAHWCFKAHLFYVILAFIAIYFSVIFFFALILWRTVWLYFSSSQKECVTSFDYFEIGNNNFEMAFDLSWTTFSTVGYGVVGPSLETNCWGVRFVCALESFCGVLYTGLCGAVLYSKLGRLLTKAPVIFSSALCLQYGDGVTEDQSSHVSDATFESGEKPPFPVLEFRVVNEYANSEKRSIVDASIECSVVISEKKGTESRHSLSSKRGIFLNDIDIQRELPENQHHFRRHVSYDLKIETSKLPYYDKVWYVRHVLDGTSPLLKRGVRREINQTGEWPSRLNGHIAIRRSLKKFYRIVVHLNGMSQVTANNVSAKKTYRYEDLYIGWQFAGILFCEKKDSEGEPVFEIDHSVIHDIVPQKGGGNERIDSD